MNAMKLPARLMSFEPPRDPKAGNRVPANSCSFHFNRFTALAIDFQEHASNIDFEWFGRFSA
jgi:hypothetical protein